MLPNNGKKLHVRSNRVLINGCLTPALILLDEGENRRILEVTTQDTGPDSSYEGSVIDIGDTIVAPVPLDLHFHGAGGHFVPPVGDAQQIDSALEKVSEIPYEWLATLPIPSIPPADPIEHVRSCMQSLRAHDSRCVGIRIEGLFLNPQRAGVWPVSTFRRPSVDLADELIAAGDGLLRVVDIAPELEGAIELIEHLVSQGIVVSLAHTDATWEQAQQAIDAGASLATHTWNAMRPIKHRDPGILGAVLSDNRVVCELICDGVHIHPAVLALSGAAKGTGGWIGVSDASPFAGCLPGEYEWAGGQVTHDGVCLRDSHGRLAGSASLLWSSLGTLSSMGMEWHEVLTAITATPRRLLNPDRSLGVEVGDLVWLCGQY